MKISDRPYTGHYSFDEAQVPAYSLPSLLAVHGGQVKSASEWMNIRRPQILKLFQDEMFGWVPPRPDKMEFELLSERRDALNGIAVCKEIRIHCSMRNGKAVYFDLLLYYPNTGQGPFPAFIGLNGRGNHGTTPEKEVRITRGPVIDWSKGEIYATTSPDESTRGIQTEAWNFKGLIERGYAGATLSISELFYDSPDGCQSSIFRLFLTQTDLAEVPCRVGAIGAWSWGLSRALDCLENQPSIDSKRVVVTGHSRLGKTALWTGAYDSRFAIVISNESGCGGACLSRRIYGETIDMLLFRFQHWFSSAFSRYRNNENSLPFDQHFLLALMAPRPVYVASAEGDRHSDPKGEYLALHAASEVYALFGAQGLSGLPESLPPLNQPVGDYAAYHIRPGEHDVTLADWEFYLDFADRHFRHS